MISKFLDYFEKVIMVVLSILLFSIIAILFWQVFTRYAFKSPSIWFEEYARYTSICVTIISYGIVIRNRSMIRIDMLDSFFKENSVWEKMHKLYVLAAEMAFAIIMLVSCNKLLPIAYRRIITGLRIKMYWAYLPFVIGTIIAVIFILERCYRVLKNRDKILL